MPEKDFCIILRRKSDTPVPPFLFFAINILSEGAENCRRGQPLAAKTVSAADAEAAAPYEKFIGS